MDREMPPHLLHLPLLTQQYQYSTRARGLGHLPPLMVSVSAAWCVSVEELLTETMFASSQSVESGECVHVPGFFDTLL